MRTLYLLRHAKSALKDAGMEDHERPLAPRGKRAARSWAQQFRAARISPGLVLCSSAVRTRETLDLVMPGFAASPIIAVERGLYLAAPAAILARLRRVEPEIEAVMVIGHNPGLHELAIDLAKHGDEALRAALRSKFPTGALAVYAVEHDWSALKPGAARLVDYRTPAEHGDD